MEDLKTRFEKHLNGYTDSELIDTYNKSVRIKAWGNARAIYIEALRKELIKRNFDNSLIIKENTFSLSKKVKLTGNKIEFLQ